MVEKLRPDLLQREVNVKADGVQTAFRKVRLDYWCVCTSRTTAGYGFILC